MPTSGNFESVTLLNPGPASDDRDGWPCNIQTCPALRTRSAHLGDARDVLRDLLLGEELARGILPGRVADLGRAAADEYLEGCFGICVTAALQRRGSNTTSLLRHLIAVPPRCSELQYVTNYIKHT